MGRPAKSNVPLLKILRAGRATEAQLRNVTADTHPRPPESAKISAAIGGVDAVTRDGLLALRGRYEVLRAANPDDPTDLWPCSPRHRP